MYTVVYQSEEHSFEGRKDAIDAAKAYSQESYEKAQVVGDDGREVMIYRDGGLEDYVYETRRRRPADDGFNKRDREDREHREGENRHQPLHSPSLAQGSREGVTWNVSRHQPPVPVRLPHGCPAACHQRATKRPFYATG